MTDIVERLRACPGVRDHDPECNCAEAADEIVRLTAWLQEIAREQDATDADYFQAIARAALAGQPRALEPKP